MGYLWPGGALELPAAVTLNGDAYRLRAAPTVDLVGALAAADWWAFVPGLLTRRSLAALTARVVDDADPTDIEDLYALATPVMVALSGVRNYPTAVRLARTITTSWLEFASWAYEHGHADPLRGPLWQFYAAAWGFMVAHRPIERSARPGRPAKQIGVDELRRRLSAPLPAVGRAGTAVARFSPAEERNAALAALNDRLPGE